MIELWDIILKELRKFSSVYRMKEHYRASYERQYSVDVFWNQKWVGVLRLVGTELTLCTGPVDMYDITNIRHWDIQDPNFDPLEIVKIINARIHGQLTWSSI